MNIEMIKKLEKDSSFVAHLVSFTMHRVIYLKEDGQFHGPFENGKEAYSLSRGTVDTDGEYEMITETYGEMLKPSICEIIGEFDGKVNALNEKLYE